MKRINLLKVTKVEYEHFVKEENKIQIVMESDEHLISERVSEHTHAHNSNDNVVGISIVNNCIYQVRKIS